MQTPPSDGEKLNGNVRHPLGRRTAAEGPAWMVLISPQSTGTGWNCSSKPVVYKPSPNGGVMPPRGPERHFRSLLRVTADRGGKMPPGLWLAQTLSRQILSPRTETRSVGVGARLSPP